MKTLFFAEKQVRVNKLRSLFMHLNFLRNTMAPFKSEDDNYILYEFPSVIHLFLCAVYSSIKSLSISYEY